MFSCIDHIRELVICYDLDVSYCRNENEFIISRKSNKVVFPYIVITHNVNNEYSKEFFIDGYISNTSGFGVGCDDIKELDRDIEFYLSSYFKDFKKRFVQLSLFDINEI